MESRILVDVKGLRKEFISKAKPFSGHPAYSVRAVDDVSFQIFKGETLALVGESGCGKSTLGRLVMRLIEPTEGAIVFDGQPLLDLDAKSFNKIRRRFQLIFQDPAAAFNPRMTVGRIVEEPMLLAGLDSAERKRRVHELLSLVGMDVKHADRYPMEFSGGQRQRVGIARALSVRPEMIICDEPVSALDVSIQAQVINLLRSLQRQFQLTYLFISHDLRVVRHIADRVAVMYLGRIVEIGSKEAIYNEPLHPYTKALISAVPVPKPGQVAIDPALVGEIPTAQNMPSGCRFHTRCPVAMAACKEKDPAPVVTADGRQVACHLLASC